MITPDDDDEGAEQQIRVSSNKLHHVTTTASSKPHLGHHRGRGQLDFSALLAALARQNVTVSRPLTVL